MKVSKRFLGVKSSAAPLFAAVALLSAPAFVSCGDDDKEGNVTEATDQSWREEAMKADTVINGHEYVDLGLSALWATCNVGASTPYEAGNYYAWGETAPKEYYDWSNYKWGNNASALRAKYIAFSPLASSGFSGNNIDLEPEDDAATVNWGEDCRMPTYAEFDELFHKCSWSWGAGLKGYIVVSDSTHKAIFLPAAGARYAREFEGYGVDGFYRSCSLNPEITSGHFGLYFDSSRHYVGNDLVGACYGRSVRAVVEVPEKEEEAETTAIR